MLKALSTLIVVVILVQALFAQTTNNLAPGAPGRGAQREGAGSATPLAWSMAQFIRLAANLQEGRNLDTPDIVAARYPRPRRTLSNN
ncbi:MAG TPA: hypothetical protein VD861_22780 [Pyrinomonadaceae bacterium]|nr:hypothetical protein [Pyrinomonadaceae bacterium]